MRPGPRAGSSDDEEAPCVSFDGVVALADAATGVEVSGIDGAPGCVAAAEPAGSSPAGEAPLVLSDAVS